MKQDQKPRLGDEAPGWKEFFLVILIAGLLIALAWIAWFEFGWFH